MFKNDFQMKAIALIVIFILNLFLSGSSFAAEEEYSRFEIAKRIQPVGQVKIAKAEVAEKPDGVGAASVGEKIYNKFCVACHSTGLAGAPKKGNQADWKPRIAKGAATLLKHAISGLNAMPPKGTCMQCTNKELQAAIKYMLP